VADRVQPRISLEIDVVDSNGELLLASPPVSGLCATPSMANVCTTVRSLSWSYVVEIPAVTLPARPHLGAGQRDGRGRVRVATVYGERAYCEFRGCRITLTTGTLR